VLVTDDLTRLSGGEKESASPSDKSRIIPVPYLGSTARKWRKVAVGLSAPPSERESAPPPPARHRFAGTCCHLATAQGRGPPLAASTLYERKRRTEAPRAGEQPLIDSGEVRRSITHVIRRGTSQGLGRLIAAIAQCGRQA
jgi:hypothetical protein